MASITIRNLDERLKGRLRMQAASRGRSMEEEARRILQAALEQSEPPSTNLADRVRRRFANLGDIELPIAPREPVREPTVAHNTQGRSNSRFAKSGAIKSRRCA